MMHPIMKRVAILVAFLALLSSCAIEPARTTREVKQEERVVVDKEVQVLFDRALESLEKEEYNNAVTLLESVVEQEKRLPAPYINLAMAYQATERDELAEASLMAALDIDLAHPVANNELGLMYRRLGRFEDARKAYTNALTRNPDYLPVIMNLGILCDLYLNDYACAMQQYEDYLDHEPDNKQVKIWISDLKNRM